LKFCNLCRIGVLNETLQFRIGGEGKIAIHIVAGGGIQKLLQ
jgi:hypothetical protein